MEILVIIGAIISLAGIGGLVWCVVLALRARRAGLPEDQARAQLQRVVVLNMGAFFVSAIGLMCVLIGVFLG